MLHHIRSKPWEPLHKKYVCQLVGRSVDLFNKSRPTRPPRSPALSRAAADAAGSRDGALCPRTRAAPLTFVRSSPGRMLKNSVYDMAVPTEVLPRDPPRPARVREALPRSGPALASPLPLPQVPALRLCVWWGSAARPAPQTDGKLVICGDTHGQLADFLWVLKQNGEPSPTNAYLLNGDIADRGENAVEILVRPAQRRSRARWGCVLTRRAWRGAARSSRSCTSCFTQRPFPSTAGTTRTSK